jgi:hypothetical protein
MGRWREKKPITPQSTRHGTPPRRSPLKPVLSACLQAVEGRLGTSAESWLRMQGAYDLAMQAAAMAKELEQIPLEAA